MITVFKSCGLQLFTPLVWTNSFGVLFFGNRFSFYAWYFVLRRNIRIVVCSQTNQISGNLWQLGEVFGSRSYDFWWRRKDPSLASIIRWFHFENSDIHAGIVSGPWRSWYIFQIVFEGHTIGCFCHFVWNSWAYTCRSRIFSWQINKKYRNM